MDVKEEMGKVAENQQLKDQKLGKLTWWIENFTGLYASKLYSEIFEVNGCRWRLLVYPKGNGVEYLSVYLDVPDSHNLPYKWSRTAKFSIALINHKDSKRTIKKETEHQFNAKIGSDWGYTQFFPLSKLHDKNGGYLVDGTCVIEAEVCLSGPFPGSTDKLSESSVHIDSSVSKPVDLDDAESIFVKAKSLLKSTSKASTSSEFSGTSAVPHFRKDAIFAKERFNELILSPLGDLIDPKHEAAMTGTLSILGDNLSLFCDEQAKQIIRLKDIFPKTIRDWKDSVQVKVSCQRFLSTFEKTKNLFEDSVKTEEGIKTKLDELNTRKKELELQIEALGNESQRLVEERLEVSKQTKQFYALVEEQAGKIEGKGLEMAGADIKLGDLKSDWTSMVSLFH